MSAGVVKLAFLNSKFKKSQFFFPSRAFKFWDLCRWTATRSLASRHSARASRALRLSLRLDPPVPAGACTFSRTRGAEAFVRSALWVLRQNFRKSPLFFSSTRARPARPRDRAFDRSVHLVGITSHQFAPDLHLLPTFVQQHARSA